MIEMSSSIIATPTPTQQQKGFQLKTSKHLDKSPSQDCSPTCRQHNTYTHSRERAAHVTTTPIRAFVDPNNAKPTSTPSAQVWFTRQPSSCPFPFQIIEAAVRGVHFLYGLPHTLSTSWSFRAFNPKHLDFTTQVELTSSTNLNPGLSESRSLSFRCSFANCPDFSYLEQWFLRIYKYTPSRMQLCIDCWPPTWCAVTDAGAGHKSAGGLAETRRQFGQLCGRTQRRLAHTLRQQQQTFGQLGLCPCWYNRIGAETARDAATATATSAPIVKQGTPVFPIVSPPEPYVNYGACFFFWMCVEWMCACYCWSYWGHCWSVACHILLTQSAPVFVRVVCVFVSVMLYRIAMHWHTYVGGYTIPVLPWQVLPFTGEFKFKHISCKNKLKCGICSDSIYTYLVKQLILGIMS